jgi:hypothetical protein
VLVLILRSLILRVLFSRIRVGDWIAAARCVRGRSWTAEVEATFRPKAPIIAIMEIQI